MIPKFPWVLLLGIFLLVNSGIALDVPFVFDSSASGVAGYSADQLESKYASFPELSEVPSVTTPLDNEVIMFPVTGGGNAPESKTEKDISELKEVFNDRVEPDNSRVHEEALVLVSKFPGDLTIEQISSIYRYLKNGEGSIKGWSYARDPRGIDYFMYANQSLRIGERAGCLGTGDCDDFAILMSALVESIGGTTRLILARNNSTGGHAYTEVYLGQLDAQNSQVEDIISWLKEKFDTDKIYTHIDTDTKDVWLNLDWGTDEKGNAHPGGPFYRGDKHIVLCIRDRYEKTELKLSELPQEEAQQDLIGPTIAVSGPSPSSTGGIIDTIGDKEYTFPNIQTNPLQERYGNVEVTLFGEIRTSLQDDSLTHENLIVDVGLIGTENATYELLDQNDITYSPILYKSIRPGRQLVYFLIPPDDLFKLIRVMPAEGSPFDIKWWATPRGINGNLAVRYYGIIDWLINPDKQSFVMQFRVTNSGTKDIYITPGNFTLLDQAGKVYQSTFGFEPEVVAPQNSTLKIKVGFTGISPMNKIAAIAYCYGKPDQIVIDLGKDQPQLSDEKAYGTLLMNTPTMNTTEHACDIVTSFSATKANSPYVLTFRFLNNYKLADPVNLSLNWNPQDAARQSDRLQRVSTGIYRLESIFGDIGSKSFKIQANIGGCSATKTILVEVTAL